MRGTGMRLSDTPGVLALDWVILTAVLMGTTAAVIATGVAGA